MLSHQQIKFLGALQMKKYRQKYRNFLVEGDKMVLELLAQKDFAIQAIYAQERWVLENEARLRPVSEKVKLVTVSELAKISAMVTPNQVLAVVDFPPEVPNRQNLAADFCFYLDGIQDPGNLGSILRVADWFGMPAVVCSPECVDVFSPKVVQASMGAVFRVKSWEVPLAEIRKENPTLPIIGATMDGENVFDCQLPAAGLVVVGNEGRGISPQTENLLTHKVSIPQHPDGQAESLNAAIAAGIIAAVLRNRSGMLVNWLTG